MSCKYCEEDFDGWYKPLDKNAHVCVFDTPHKQYLDINWYGHKMELSISYCPMCGRKLGRINTMNSKTIRILEEIERPTLACGFDRQTEILQAIGSLLKEYKKQEGITNEIKEYANWEIEHYTEDIADYIDDDRVGNARFIGELQENREHWKDIMRIINNEETYIDYKNY